MKSVRVLLVEDHAVVRESISNFLNQQSDMSVIGQASDGEVRHFRAGSVLLAEDTTGKGHVSWVISKTDLLAAVVQLPN